MTCMTQNIQDRSTTIPALTAPQPGASLTGWHVGKDNSWLTWSCYPI